MYHFLNQKTKMIRSIILGNTLMLFIIMLKQFFKQRDYKHIKG